MGTSAQRRIVQVQTAVPTGLILIWLNVPWVYTADDDLALCGYVDFCRWNPVDIGEGVTVSKQVHLLVRRADQTGRMPLGLFEWPGN